MSKRLFVYETTDHVKPRIYALIVGILLVAAGAWVVYDNLTAEEDASSFIQLPDFDNITAVTLFVSSALGGLFFIPIPVELLFIQGLRQGNTPLIIFIAVMSGFLLGHIVSYLIGYKLSHLVQYFLSPKKMYSLRRMVNKYGSYAIIGVNIIPGPSPQLTFGLGIARYNFVRLITLVIIGNALKYGAIIGFYTLVT